MGRYEFLDLAIAQGVATVRLNRPPVNALTLKTYHEIAEVFQEIGQRDDVRVAIFTGTDRYFSAGRDIKVAGTESQEARFQAIFDGAAAQLHCAVPVIGAINGPAVGAGFALVLYCDIILASESATFSWPEINLGLSGGMALTLRGLTTYQARKLCFTGDPVNGHELHQMGVVDEVVPDSELMPRANELAAKLAAKPPTALRAAKRTANEVEKMADFELAFTAVESRVSLSLIETADHKEAAVAFQQRRTTNGRRLSSRSSSSLPPAGTAASPAGQDPGSTRPLCARPARHATGQDISIQLTRRAHDRIAPARTENERRHRSEIRRHGRGDGGAGSRLPCQHRG